MPMDSQALTLQHVCNVHEHNPVDAGGIILLHKIFLMFQYFSGLKTTSQTQILRIGDLERVGLGLFFTYLFLTGRVFWILLKFQHKTNGMKSYFVIMHNGFVKLVCFYFAERQFYNKYSTRSA